jgi:hypothetical protein
MTGAYVRNQNKETGKWESIEVEYLSNQEREEFFKSKEIPELIRWIDMLCNVITNNIIEEKEGE